MHCLLNVLGAAAFSAEACCSLPRPPHPRAPPSPPQAASSADSYTASSAGGRSWGQDRFIPLDDLRRPERAYLLGDRLVLGVEIRAVEWKG